MSSASILGICLKWAVDWYQIKSPTMNKLITHLIDLENVETIDKIRKLA